MDIEKVFKWWVERNLPVAQNMTLLTVMHQTWAAGAAAGRLYQCDHGDHCLWEIRDLKPPRTMIGEGI